MSVLKLFLIMFLLTFNQAETDSTPKDCLRSEVQNTYLSLKQSFHNFFGRVKQYFIKPFEKFEKIRRKIKKAFYRFLNESLSDEYEKMLTRRKFNFNNYATETSLSELIVAHGYRLETHTALTKDGYMLTLHRIIKTSKSSTIRSKVILLHHGLWGSATDWVLLGSGKALPYLLVETGYDVWLMNARGNRYSNTHATKATDSIEYWNFSWHEMGMFDLSTIIDYITEITNGKLEINFIAYSMGATALLVLLSTSPQYNDVLSSVVLVAPLVLMSNVKGPMRYLANLYDKGDPSFLNNFNHNELMPSTTFSDHVREKFCTGSKMLCANPLLLLGDGGKEIPKINLTASILGHVPAGGSKKTLLHYLQLVKSGEFRMFDYGQANTIIYGNKIPPTYDLNNISRPILVFNSPGDWLSTTKDISKFIQTVSGTVSQVTVSRNDFSHFDFLWADDAPELIYKPILMYLSTFYS